MDDQKNGIDTHGSFAEQNFSFVENLNALYKKRVSRAHEIIEKLNFRLIDMQNERVELLRALQDLEVTKEDCICWLKERFESLLSDLEAYYDQTFKKILQDEQTRKDVITHRL